MALANVTVMPGQRTKWQKWFKQRVKDMRKEKMEPEFTNDAKFLKKHFNFLLKPYSPCGLEYVPDTSTNFKGVYIDYFGMAENWLQAVTYSRVAESLLDFGCVDNASQAIEIYNKRFGDRGLLEDSHIILLLPIRRGGFRWHKNGGYLGKAKTCCEYFDDEPDEKLQMVYLYNVIKIG